MSERECFFSKPIAPEKKGCKSEATHRVIFGEGHFIDVCVLHLQGFLGFGYKIIKLEDSEVKEG